ncbi:conserved exported hypothetical protein [Candidatus Desulfosporosinus infrequens]|uniref:Rv2525c-like glycoside hydrolase-like domain-containing protein n=1 Tax=Candidatus Desulfosporosinus infrequens TaxID=2043169 RepID=A0A2U3L5C7_9FIRM|nr:conserved exported hypothetical protein [Candidatus Desulfosporosinus infrequens]
MEAIDCSTILTSTIASSLNAAGIVAVGRYLGYKTQGWSKSISPTELSAIQSSGLSVFLIWESDPTTAGYFSYDQGVNDGGLALAEMDYLGAPKSTAVYFTVDYDAQSSDMAAIIDYFSGVRDGLNGEFLVGAYGSYSVLGALQASSYAPDKYWQTYAWSSGMVFSGNDIYQYQNDTTLQGIAVDLDTIQYNSGCWPELEGNIMDYLVLYYGDADLQMAADLAQNFQCPIVQAAYATPALLASARTMYQVGGASAPTGVTLLAGADRFATMKAVLVAIGKD